MMIGEADYIAIPLEDFDTSRRSGHAVLQDSLRALEWALDNIYKPGDKLNLLHVVPDAIMTAGDAPIWAAVIDAPLGMLTTDSDAVCSASACLPLTVVTATGFNLKALTRSYLRMASNSLIRDTH
jgi:hypothetical protein